MTERRPFRVLFIPPRSIGDAILTTGILRHFHETHPEAAFTIVVMPPLSDCLFTGLPGLERIIEWRKRTAKAHWPALWSSVVGDRWDVVVDMRRSALAFTLRTRSRLVPWFGLEQHRVEAVAALIGRAADPPAPWLATSPANERRAEVLLGAGGPLVALGPGGSAAAKRWPAERFAELTAQLVAGPLPGARLLLVGGPDDRPLAAPFRQRFAPGDIVDCLGLGLGTTFACLKRCRLFVGNDSSMMHLAAAAGTATLGLFGPTRDKVYRPWCSLGAAVRARPFTEYDFGRPGFWETPQMLDLDVATVMAAATALLDRAKSAPATLPVAG